MRRSRGTLLLCLFATCIWCLLVLYPNPIKILQSVHRSIKPPIDTVSIKPLLNQLQSHDPAYIERFVLTTIPYQYDWVTYRVPWYYPSVSEVLAHGVGDCKSRMILFASILEQLGIDYEIRYSLNHYWIHYDGKLPTALENDQIAFLIRDGDTRVIQLPEIDGRMIIGTLGDVWDVMPTIRKWGLFFGLFVPTLLIKGIFTLKGRWGKTVLSPLQDVVLEQEV